MAKEDQKPNPEDESPENGAASPRDDSVGKIIKQIEQTRLPGTPANWKQFEPQLKRLQGRLGELANTSRFSDLRKGDQPDDEQEQALLKEVNEAFPKGTLSPVDELEAPLRKLILYATLNRVYEQHVLKIMAEFQQRFSNLASIDRISDKQALAIIDQLRYYFADAFLIEPLTERQASRVLVELAHDEPEAFPGGQLNWELLVPLLANRDLAIRRTTKLRVDAVAKHLKRHFPEAYKNSEVGGKPVWGLLNHLRGAFPNAPSAGEAITSNEQAHRILNQFKQAAPYAFTEGKADWVKIINLLHYVNEGIREWKGTTGTGEHHTGKASDAAEGNADTKHNGDTTGSGGVNWADMQQIIAVLAGLMDKKSQDDREQVIYQQWTKIQRDTYNIVVLVSGIIVGLMFTAALMLDLPMEVRLATILPIILFSGTVLHIIFITFPSIARAIIHNPSNASRTLHGVLQRAVLVSMWRIWRGWRIEEASGLARDGREPLTVKVTKEGKPIKVHLKDLQRFERIPYALFALGIFFSIVLVVAALAFGGDAGEMKHYRR